jgi:alpha-D-xyloside xylohydrolase
MSMGRRLPFLLIVLLSGEWSHGVAATLIAGDAKLDADAGRITITRAGRDIVRLTSIRFNYAAGDWQTVESDEDSIVLRGRFPAGVDYGRDASDTRERSVDLVITKEARGFRLHADPEWGRQVTLEFDYLGDHFFGLSEALQPDNRLSPDITGTSIAVEVAGEADTMRENFASAYSAFYMSSYGYGAFFDSFARGRYEFAINGKNRIHHDTGSLDWYVFPGDDGREIHRAYFALIGAPKAVPVWALGPVGWRDQNDGGAPEILDDIEHMTTMQIPFTAWFVDRPYSEGANAWSKMNFAPAFKNPDVWIGRIRRDYGLEFMTWASPATFGDTRFPRHLAGHYTYLDLSDPATVAAYEDALRLEQYAHGVKGHKIDRADESFPIDEPWQDEAVPPAERRNRYVYLLQKTQDEALRAAWGPDQFTFARAAIQRVQPFLSALWGGDPRSTWEGLAGNFANAARAAFLGFPVWGTDSGGYLGEGRIPEELFVRWLEAASMSGLFEIKLDGAGGSGEDRLPWHYDGALQTRFRAICAERMRMIPYLYSLAHTSAVNGTLMQPLAYRHLADPKTWDVWDEFYAGDAILVAPVLQPGESRSVYLPKGEWRDFDEPAKRFAGGRTYEIAAPIDKLPRFVRENSLLVSGNVYQGNDRRWSNADPMLIIDAFPGHGASSTEFTYVDLNDDDVEKAIRLARSGRTVTLSAPAMVVDTQLRVVLDIAPGAVTLDGEDVESNYDADAKMLSLIVPAGQKIELVVAP